MVDIKNTIENGPSIKDMTIEKFYTLPYCWGSPWAMGVSSIMGHGDNWATNS